MYYLILKMQFGHNIIYDQSARQHRGAAGWSPRCVHPEEFAAHSEDELDEKQSVERLAKERTSEAAIDELELERERERARNGSVTSGSGW